MNPRDTHPVWGMARVARLCRSRRVGVLIVSSTALITVLSFLAGGW